jgi:hypothetical protein
VTDLPLQGAELVGVGVVDLTRGIESERSLLVSMPAPRLRALGFDVQTPLHEPELRLLRRLADWHGFAAKRALQRTFGGG